MARRETAVHYLLEHRFALLLAGFVLLFDQLVVDWGQSLAAGGAQELTWLGPFGVGAALPSSAGTLLVALLLGLAGLGGVLFRSSRIRRTSAAPTDVDAPQPRSGAASELLVLAGFVAAVVNLALRGTAGTPIVLGPLGWGLPPALLIALPAAVVLAAQCGSSRADARRDAIPTSPMGSNPMQSRPRGRA